MDGALLVAVWFASALLIVGVALARGSPGAALPTWLLVTMMLLGPAGLLVLIVWVRGHRTHGNVPPVR